MKKIDSIQHNIMKNIDSTCNQIDKLKSIDGERAIAALNAIEARLRAVTDRSKVRRASATEAYHG